MAQTRIMTVAKLIGWLRNPETAKESGAWLAGVMFPWRRYGS
jgi:hypothetical protein